MDRSYNMNAQGPVCYDPETKSIGEIKMPISICVRSLRVPGGGIGYKQRSAGEAEA